MVRPHEPGHRATGDAMRDGQGGWCGGSRRGSSRLAGWAEWPGTRSGKVWGWRSGCPVARTGSIGVRCSRRGWVAGSAGRRAIGRCGPGCRCVSRRVRPCGRRAGGGTLRTCGPGTWPPSSPTWSRTSTPVSRSGPPSTCPAMTSNATWVRPTPAPTPTCSAGRTATSLLRRSVLPDQRRRGVACGWCAARRGAGGG